MRFKFWIVILLIIAGGAFAYRNTINLFLQDYVYEAKPLANTGPLPSNDVIRQLPATPSTAGRIYIPLAPRADFNFKTRQDIWMLRMKQVALYPALAPIGYEPSPKVFLIEDGKPWWGVYGATYYGPGMQSIEGPSEQSFPILNPYMLVSLMNDHVVAITTPQHIPIAAYPIPLSLLWEPAKHVADARYDVTSYFNFEKHIGDLVNGETLAMNAINARDMGYNYIMLAAECSRNVTSNIAQAPAHIEHLIHVGNSCRYPGGCNNFSPIVPTNLQVLQLPATACLKLWRTAPANAAAPPDMYFAIEMQ